MRRIRGFRIVVLPTSSWSSADSKGVWRLPKPQLTAASDPYESWHRCWFDALQRYATHSDGESSDVVVVANNRTVLATISRLSMVQHVGGAADPDDDPWSSTPAQFHQLKSLASRPSGDVFANYNRTNIAWVAMTGAVFEVPCWLGFLELKARGNPDGFYGRLLARKNELRDMFRRG